MSIPLGRLIEVANDRRHLSLHRGFLVVDDSERRQEIARIPIDDVAAVVANAHGLTYTNNLLVALAERCAPLVLCDANHNAVGMLIPVDGNFEQAKRFDAQLACSMPTKKRLWAALVRQKLLEQAHVLASTNRPSAPIEALARRVRSGDPDNLEAQGARKYWSLLFGDDFRRDREGGGANAMLNYGYTVLRAAVARAVVATGLHPTIGVHHSNAGNAMRLVDDLVEPFRPRVDWCVWQLLAEGRTELDAEVKKSLALMLYADRRSARGATSTMECINRLTSSLSQVFLGERKSLEFPEPCGYLQAID